MDEQKRLLRLIGKVWEKFPDLRLCQLFGNCFEDNDLYNITDERLENALLTYLAKYGGF